MFKSKSNKIYSILLLPFAAIAVPIFIATSIAVALVSFAIKLVLDVTY